MRTPSLKSAAEKILRVFSFFHLTYLRSSKVAQVSPEIVSKFEAAHDRFGALIAARAAAELKLVEAAAHRSRARRLMERGIRDFAYAVLGAVQEDRSAPLYRAYFPDGYGYISRSNLDGLIQSAERMLAQLAQVPDEELESAGAELASVVDQAKVEQVRYGEAKTALDAAKQAVEVGKRPWREAYRGSFYALSIFHADDPRQAEDYFRQVRRRASQEEEEFEAAPEGGAGVGGSDVTDGDPGTEVLVEASVNGNNGDEPSDAEETAAGSSQGA